MAASARALATPSRGLKLIALKYQVRDRIKRRPKFLEYGFTNLIADGPSRQAFPRKLFAGAGERHRSCASEVPACRLGFEIGGEKYLYLEVQG